MAQKLWQEDKDGVSKISNTEWGIVIGALWIIDGIQIGLDLLFQVGVLLNRFIDIMVGLAWPTYLYLRGVNLKDIKMVGGIFLAFLGDMVPDMDALPWWGADGIYAFTLVKAGDLAAKNPAVGKAVKKAEGAAVAAAAVAAAPETGGASLAAGGAAEGAVAGAEAGAIAEEAGGTAATESGEAVAAEGEAGAEGNDAPEDNDENSGTAEDDDVRKKQFLEQLKNTPDIDTACQKTGIDRETFDRWQKEDQRFANDVQRIIGEVERREREGGGYREGGASNGGFAGGRSGGRGRGIGGPGSSGYRGSGRRGRSGIAAFDNLLDLSSGYDGNGGGGSPQNGKTGIPQADNLLDLSLSYGARKKKKRT